MIVEKSYLLQGLNCANCASKIELEINKLESVSSASVNLFTSSLSMTLQGAEQDDRTAEITAVVEKIVHKYEPHVVVVDKEALKAGGNAQVQIHDQTLGQTHNSAHRIAQNDRLSFVTDVHIPGQAHSQIHNQAHIHGHAHDQARNLDEAHAHGHAHVSDAVHAQTSGDVVTPEAIRNLRMLVQLLLGASFFAVGLILNLFPSITVYLSVAFFFISYGILGFEVLLRAFKNITQGQVFDENFLMSIATIGAFIIGEFPEAVAVMLFYQIGEYFQETAVQKSRRSIAELMDIRPDYANIKMGEDLVKVAPDTVNVGSFIVAKPGERIPLDGVIVEGEGLLDTKSLTGESLPRAVKPGDTVLSGCVNQNGLLTIRVTKTFGESTVAKIIDLVENAGSKKAPTENFITTFSSYYTPAVVALAALIAVVPPLFMGGGWSDWVYRGLIFLVISCPCALVISIPLGFFGGIGGASRRGILFKGGNYLEAFNNIDIVVFDKTGTLTKGVFEVTGVEAADGFTQEQVLELAAHAECYSNHPIALSIRKAYGKAIDNSLLQGYEELAGNGISVLLGGKRVLAGNSKLLEKEGVMIGDRGAGRSAGAGTLASAENEKIGTTVYVAVDSRYSGCIIISDEVKPDSREAIAGLRARGIRKTIMLTGDNSFIAEKIAGDLAIDEVYAELLPHEKVEKLEMLSAAKRPKGKLAFVGDGINDAPVLARADIGVAMGGLGSDAAIEAADVVLMTDEPAKLVTAVEIAKATKRIVWQNIIFALSVKAVFLILGAMGVATMWEAVFADVGVALIAILNSMRAMR